MSEHLLEIKNLIIQYRTEYEVVKAVNDLSFTLNRSETIGLVGETGAGKTTTALGIMRLIPDPPGEIISGGIFFEGENLLLKSEREMRKIRGGKISMVFQDPMTSLNPVLRVGEQIIEVIRLHSKISRVKSTEAAIKLLELVGIPSDRFNEYPHQFSGGMKQRVVIAIAIACNPMLLIADEPTTALDVTIQFQVLELINKLRKEINTAMILITHDLGIVAEMCDKVAIMYTGEIVEYGPIREIFHNAKHPYTIGLFNSLPDLDTDLERLNEISGTMPDPTNLPLGCKFQPRCLQRKSECNVMIPKMIEILPEHSVKCFLYDNA